MPRYDQYNHILIALEESEYSYRAATEVYKMMEDTTKITFIHAIDPNRTDGNVLPSVLNDVKYEQFEKQYETIAKEYDERDIEHDLKIVKGNIPKLIIEEANSGEYDALIIGATGKQRFTGFEFGSVSNKVLRKVEIPIVLVK